MYHCFFVFVFLHCGFFCQIAKRYPGLMMKLLLQTIKTPNISFQPNNVTIQASATVTAYAIQPNTTLTPLFVLNLVGLHSIMVKIIKFITAQNWSKFISIAEH